MKTCTVYSMPCLIWRGKTKKGREKKKKKPPQKQHIEMRSTRNQKFWAHACMCGCPPTKGARGYSRTTYLPWRGDLLIQHFHFETLIILWFLLMLSVAEQMTYVNFILRAWARKRHKKKRRKREEEKGNQLTTYTAHPRVRTVVETTRQKLVWSSLEQTTWNS